VDTYHRAQRGDLRLVTLQTRYRPGMEGGEALPEVLLVDLRQRLREGDRGLLSRPLLSAMEVTLHAGRQIILFLNRRGSATTILCHDCGEALRCPRCSMPLVYHRNPQHLRCHHCQRSYRPIARCPKCGRGDLHYLGVGTERVEDEVVARFPSRPRPFVGTATPSRRTPTVASVCSTSSPPDGPTS